MLALAVTFTFLASLSTGSNAINIRLVNRCWPARTLRVQWFSATDGVSGGLTLGPNVYTNLSYPSVSNGVIWAETATSSDRCPVRTALMLLGGSYSGSHNRESIL